jgi:SAM-dependent methyltransferase
MNFQGKKLDHRACLQFMVAIGFPPLRQAQGRDFRKITISACLAFFLTLASIAANAQQTAPKQERETSKPYTGDLSVFEYPGRDKKLQIDRVMDILGITPGKTVADIGAGSGWFSVRAARRVTQTGLVYAVDINPEAIRYVQERMGREGIGNVKTILSKPEDPLLPAQSIDAVLLLKTYHEVADPVALLKNLHKSLRPGARVGIIDRNGTAEVHGVNQDIVVREARQAGYRLVSKYEFVKPDKEDYFLVFELRK